MTWTIATLAVNDTEKTIAINKTPNNRENPLHKTFFLYRDN